MKTIELLSGLLLTCVLAGCSTNEWVRLSPTAAAPTGISSCDNRPASLGTRCFVIRDPDQIERFLRQNYSR